jgi:hypothetical protein
MVKLGQNSVAVGEWEWQKKGGGGAGSGSGWAGVVPLDRGDQCGSNGGGLGVVVVVLAELRCE